MHIQIEEQEATRTVMNVAGQQVAVICRIKTVSPAVVDYKTVAEFVGANQRQDDGDWVVDVPGLGEVSWPDRDDLVSEVLAALNEHGISVTGGPPAYDLDR
jgi:hypothetical protein